MLMKVHEAKKSEFNRAPPDFILSSERVDPENGGMVMSDYSKKKFRNRPSVDFIFEDVQNPKKYLKKLFNLRWPDSLKMTR